VDGGSPTIELSQNTLPAETRIYVLQPTFVGMSD
jgi:hypothetical protein